MFVASEQTHGRQQIRLERDFVGWLFVEGVEVPAHVLNVSEQRASLTIGRPIFTSQDAVQLALTSSRGVLLKLTARIVRQEVTPSGEVSVGLQFDELDDDTRQVLVDKIFGDPVPWEDTYRVQPGTGDSLRSLVHALTIPWHSFNWNRRSMIRVTGGSTCQIKTPHGLMKGRVENMSFTGVSALFTSSIKEPLVGSRLQLPGVTLKVSPVAMIRKRRKMLVRFRVDSIEAGENRWRTLHYARWQKARS